MEDPEMSEIFEKFLGSSHIDDKAKIAKLKQLLIIFSNRWAEERTISCVGASHDRSTETSATSCWTTPTSL